MSVAERVSAGIPPARWVRPLEGFLGNEEPSEDDSEDWTIRDIVPRGEPWIWGGPPKSGKTWAMLDLAISVSLGKPWLGAFDNTWHVPKRVLVVALEDGQRRLRKRVWELCRGREITPNDPTLRDNLAISREPLSIPDNRDERVLVAELKAWKPEVVIVDSLTRVQVGDQNAIKDVARFTKIWVKMCSDVGAAIGFLHHTSKTNEKDKRDPFDLLRGSSDLMAATRNAIVSRPFELPGQRLQEIAVRGNLDLRRETFAIGFERTQVDGRWSVKLVDRGEVGILKGEVEKQKTEIRIQKKVAESQGRRSAAIRMGAAGALVTSRALGEAIGMAPNTALKVLQSLESEGVMEVVTGRNGGYRIRPNGGN